MRKPLSLDELEQGILSGDRARLAQAITLVESRRAQDAPLAAELLRRVAPRTGGSLRLGISGPPGAGKSTFIEALGCKLVADGHKLAVLAVDPSSRVSGGSILGDKTRMAALSQLDSAFIRPSPSGGSLGGVARRTRDALRLCEAAGFDVVIVETVGVGQSEVQARDLTDLFLVLLLPASGDDLQGIKRGVMELADLVAVNKADGDTKMAALRTQAEMAAALHMGAGEERPVLACSAATLEGLDTVWEAARSLHAAWSANGKLAARRRDQELRWFRQRAEEAVLERVLGAEGILAERLRALERELGEGRLETPAALERLLADWPAAR